jgi:DNA-binding response OmpR family regulator
LPQNAVGKVARILVIDDDQLFVTLMVHALKQHGHEVEYALDGLAGSQAFARSHFDVVICDIVMPEQEGVQTIREMRDAQPDVAIVAVSGGLAGSHLGDIDVLNIAAKIGADLTLKKPFQLSVLVDVVDRALSLRHPARKVSQS